MKIIDILSLFFKSCNNTYRIENNAFTLMVILQNIKSINWFKINEMEWQIRMAYYSYVIDMWLFL